MKNYTYTDTEGCTANCIQSAQMANGEEKRGKDIQMCEGSSLTVAPSQYCIVSTSQISNPMEMFTLEFI